jgi:UDP-glucose 4-epimerase
MVVPRFVRAALANEVIEIHGDGNQTRCFCHVQDTIQALVALMSHAESAGEIFNVGSQERVSILGLADRVRKATGSTSELVHVPYDEVYGQGIEDMIHRMPSIDKVRAAVGWTPERGLEDILTDVIASVRAEGVPA